VHVAKIEIRNVKGFGEGEEGVDLDLTQGGRRTDLAGWTVLAGPNGSGKTTLLQAVALGVVDPNTYFHVLPWLPRWIREGAKSGIARLGLVAEGDDSPPEALGRNDVDYIIEWNLNSFSLRSKVRINEGRKLFVAGYGPIRRVRWGTVGDGYGPSATNPLPSLAVLGLFSQEGDLSESVEWLKALDYRALKDDQASSKLLQGVRALLEDDLLPGDVKILGVEPDGLRVRHRGKDLLLQSLSDGYRTTAAFVIDIVMRMASVFGADMRIEHDAKGKPYIPHAGVVLVDEMELHLHPSWQQKIGFWLKEHFPRVQFIVTTHSPFICQAADCLVRLSPPGEGRPVAEIVDDETFRQVVRSGADDAVVSDLFGLPYPHSSEVERARERLAALEAKELRGSLGAAERQELEDLQAKLPYAPGASVERMLRKADAAQ
jgi:hypothetical protein